MKKIYGLIVAIALLVQGVYATGTIQPEDVTSATQMTTTDSNSSAMQSNTITNPTQPVTATQETTSSSRCELNGQEISCEELEAKAQWWLKWWLYVFWALAIVGILLTILWIWMLVDAIRFQEKDKALWIVLMIFTWWIGAIIYYFAAKRARKK